MDDEYLIEIMWLLDELQTDIKRDTRVEVTDRVSEIKKMLVSYLETNNILKKG